MEEYDDRLRVAKAVVAAIRRSVEGGFADVVAVGEKGEQEAAIKVDALTHVARDSTTEYYLAVDGMWHRAYNYSLSSIDRPGETDRNTYWDFVGSMDDIIARVADHTHPETPEQWRVARHLAADAIVGALAAPGQAAPAA